MRALRRLRFLHRLVTAWFVLSLGVAVAAPLVHPVAMELVCSAGGMVKVVVRADDGAQGTDAGAGGMDCPLCAMGAAPPPAAPHPAAMPCPLGLSLRSIPAARLAAATAAPLPARGPPANA